MRSTSLEAYYCMLEAGFIAQQEYDVIKYLKSQDEFISRNEIERGTGIRINAVSGRVNSLVKKELVFEQPTPSTCPISGRSVHKVGLSNPIKDIELAN